MPSKLLHYWFHFPLRSTSFSQLEIVDSASAGRWVCLQIRNTTQGIPSLSLNQDRLSYSSGCALSRHIPLPSPPLRPGASVVSLRWRNGQKKSAVSSGNLPLWPRICTLVYVMVLYARGGGIVAGRCQRDLSPVILILHLLFVFPPSSRSARPPNPLKRNIKKMAELGGAAYQFPPARRGYSNSWVYREARQRCIDSDTSL
jgi:hypothetical protein